MSCARVQRMVWSLRAVVAAVAVAFGMASASASASASTSSSAASLASASASSAARPELVSVQVYSRHGNRAPGDVVSWLCPNNARNLARHFAAVDPGGMTGRGMHQMHELGAFLRDRYVRDRDADGDDSNGDSRDEAETDTDTDTRILSPAFSEKEVYFRASGATRCMQSAQVAGFALYPAGTAPAHFSTKLPTPMPVAMAPIGHDVLLESRQTGTDAGGCKAQLHADANAWEAEGGDGYSLLHRGRGAELVKRLSALCGYDLYRAPADSGGGESVAKAFKDVTDALVADHDERFRSSISGWDGDAHGELGAFRVFAQQLLQGRLFRTPAQATYIAGDLPYELLKNVYASIAARDANADADAGSGSASRQSKRLKLYSYHAHREMMYAVAHYFGLPVQRHPSVGPTGVLPPGSAFVFELYRTPRSASDADALPPPAFVPDSRAGAGASPGGPSPSLASETSAAPYGGASAPVRDGQYFVRTFVWTPCNSSADFPDPPYTTPDGAELSSSYAFSASLDATALPHHRRAEKAEAAAAATAGATTTSSAGAVNDNGARGHARSCPYHQVQLSACSSADCPLREFQDIIARRTRETHGGWMALCHSTLGTATRRSDAAADTNSGGADGGSSGTYMALAGVFGALAALTTALLVWQCRQTSRAYGYTELHGINQSPRFAPAASASPAYPPAAGDSGHDHGDHF